MSNSIDQYMEDSLLATGNPEYGIVLAKDVMIPMRDGIQLATDIYRPAIDGEPIPEPLPTILGRTCYDKTWPELWVDPVANFFTPKGYVTVLQDVRGRGNSKGTGQYNHTANAHEGQDGYDTVEWIASRDWSNGKVGMVGSSQGGIVQNQASLTRPPHLAALWVDVAPTNIFSHEAREGGAMCLHMFSALFLHAYDSQEIRDNLDAQQEVISGIENMANLLKSTPFKPNRTPLRVVPNLEKVLFHYYYEGEYTEFWSQEACDQERAFHKMADIPAVYSGGWYDPFSAAATAQFTAMSEQNNSPQRLILGPWNHTGMRSDVTYTGDVDFGESSNFGDSEFNERRLRWFDHWLRDVSNDVEEEPPVHIFVMGGGDGNRNSAGRLNHGGRWRSEKEWPLTRTTTMTYYLRTGGGLSIELPGDDPPALYINDPDHPVPTIGGAIAGFLTLAPPLEGSSAQASIPLRARFRSVIADGGAHQKENPDVFGSNAPYPLLTDRKDVLVFQTPVLEHDIEVTGSITVNLWVSSSAIDTDYTAKIVDVYAPSNDYPGGYHLNLVDSIQRARYRNGYKESELMTPNALYEISISLPPISNLFKAGHSIRLDIASSNFPRFDVNPNTGEPMGRHTHTVKAANTVYLDRTRPSHICVPIIPIA